MVWDRNIRSRPAAQHRCSARKGPVCRWIATTMHRRGTSPPDIFPSRRNRHFRSPGGSSSESSRERTDSVHRSPAYRQRTRAGCLLRTTTRIARFRPCRPVRNAKPTRFPYRPWSLPLHPRRVRSPLKLHPHGVVSAPPEKQGAISERGRAVGRLTPFWFPDCLTRVSLIVALLAMLSNLFGGRVQKFFGPGFLGTGIFGKRCRDGPTSNARIFVSLVA